MPQLSLVKKTALRRQIDREWAGHLKPAEHKCLLFLFTVTVEWGKEADRVKRDHFVNGLKYAAGTGLCEKTVRTALASLTDRGTIYRKRTPYGYVYGIDFDWNPAMIPEPKKGRATFSGGLNTPKESGKNYPSRVVKFTTAIEEEHTRKGHTSHSPSPIGSGDGASLLPNRKSAQKPTVQPDRFAGRRVDDVVKAESAAKKRAAKESGKTDPKTIEAVWSLAHSETFPGVLVPAWTKQTSGQAYLFVKQAPNNARGLEVLEWSAREWRLLMSTRFAWMTEAPPPEFPQIGFMLKFKDHFYAAFNDRERLRSELSVTGRERQVKRLKHQGLTTEEAEKVVTEKTALSNERQAIARDRKVLDDMLARVDRQNNARQPPKVLPRSRKSILREPAVLPTEEFDDTYVVPQMPEVPYANE